MLVRSFRNARSCWIELVPPPVKDEPGLSEDGLRPASRGGGSDIGFEATSGFGGAGLGGASLGIVRDGGSLVAVDTGLNGFPCLCGCPGADPTSNPAWASIRIRSATDPIGRPSGSAACGGAGAGGWLRSISFRRSSIFFARGSIWPVMYSLSLAVCWYKTPRWPLGVSRLYSFVPRTYSRRLAAWEYL